MKGLQPLCEVCVNWLVRLEVIFGTVKFSVKKTQGGSHWSDKYYGAELILTPAAFCNALGKFTTLLLL